MLKLEPWELAERKVDLMRRILIMTEELTFALAGENPVEIMSLLLKRQGLMTQVDDIDAKLQEYDTSRNELAELAAQTAALARTCHELDGANLKAAHQLRADLRQQIESVERGRRSANAYESVESPGTPMLLDDRK